MNLAHFTFIKPRTHKFYIVRDCTNIVYIKTEIKSKVLYDPMIGYFLIDEHQNLEFSICVMSML